MEEVIEVLVVVPCVELVGPRNVSLSCIGETGFLVKRGCTFGERASTARLLGKIYMRLGH